MYAEKMSAFVLYRRTLTKNLRILPLPKSRKQKQLPQIIDKLKKKIFFCFIYGEIMIKKLKSINKYAIILMYIK